MVAIVDTPWTASIPGLFGGETKPGEITDKRSINQRLVMQRRAGELELLYALRIDARIIEPAATSQPSPIQAQAASTQLIQR